MNQFTDRQLKIIHLITNQNDTITCERLSQLLNYSKRTIQNDIAYINKKTNLIINTPYGYKIDPTVLSQIDPSLFVENTNNTHIILRRLIKKNKTYNINQLADKLYISVSTLEKEIKKISKILADHNLELKRERGSISIEGSEYYKRKLIMELIKEETSSTFNSINNISKYFDQLNFTRIQTIVNESINRHGYYVDKNYSFNLYLNITIALFRMKSAIYIKDLPKNYVDQQSVEYQISKDICKSYSLHWNIQPHEEDIIYIALLLSGQIKNQEYLHSNEKTNPVLAPDFIRRIDQILSETFNYYMFSIDYFKSLQNFAMHIDGMIKRIRNNQLISNDILDTLKKNCPFVFEVSIHISKKIADEFHIEISDSEIGFIAVHIGLLMNASEVDLIKVKILLICSDYLNLIDTVSAQILKYHKDYIDLTVVTPDEDDINIDYNVDLIISIKPINIIGKKVIIISPLYTVADELKIYHAINEKLIEKDIANKNKVLSSYFHEHLFFKTDAYSTKESAIRFLCEKIIGFGLEKQGYTEKVLYRESLSTTCFFHTFAIPHSMDFSNTKTMFTVLISEKGIQWDDSLIHIVLLITISKQDKKIFKTVYDSIIRSLSDTSKIPKLIHSKDLSEFISQL
ncbi:BglG family transcription antiterminator [Traorella massiliensis]|uniref:BglG family transcription antiterminator n=1 Tax=Traorella massiliensis TaxID=1903263 RepID=UPI0008F91AC0|nr:PRD domain-containing protein [Traorella massiliensis]